MNINVNKSKAVLHSLQDNQATSILSKSEFSHTYLYQTQGYIQHMSQSQSQNQSQSQDKHSDNGQDTGKNKNSDIDSEKTLMKKDESLDSNQTSDVLDPETVVPDLNTQTQSQSQSLANSGKPSAPSSIDSKERSGLSFDELIFKKSASTKDKYRPAAKEVGKWIESTNLDTLIQLNEQAADIFYRKGVTFTVYSDAKNIERMIPFDIIPRVISSNEWHEVKKGCQQRIKALNAFLHDIYHEQNILKEGIVPASYVYASGCYEPWMMGINLDRPIYSHISGIDLIRDEGGNFCVLEDNLRTPSGVSYMLESRNISKQLLKNVMEKSSVLEINDYPQRLKACLCSATNKYNPQIVILTPGRFNSAYYEHAFLAREMNVPLVHGYDLLVEDSKVYMRGIRGKLQVDIIYRRIDDPYLDPLAFRSDSILGVSGLMSAYRAGNVVIVNAPGTGVADDKSLYPFVPDMIEYYFNEKPLLPNIKTFQCRKPDELEYVLDTLDQLVVKETQGSGGYGMLIGPSATSQEIEAYRERLLANPSGFIAQPTISLSTNPTTIGNEIAPRHIDLRPFILSHGDGTVDIVPGGLTRVAMVENSLVVNSSQGGGIKDTWITDIEKLAASENENRSLNPFTLESIDTIAARHDYLNETAYPVEVGYDTTDQAPMILLLSTANHLVWLGRYSERLQYYDNLMNKLINRQLTHYQIENLVTCLGFPTLDETYLHFEETLEGIDHNSFNKEASYAHENLPSGNRDLTSSDLNSNDFQPSNLNSEMPAEISASHASKEHSNRSADMMALSILKDLEASRIPDVIHAIETNVQEAKGVLGKDTAELYNLIKRLSSGGTYRAATLQLQACNEAMKHEHPIVICFWQLGHYFERLERTVLLKENAAEASLEFKQWVNELPENTRWRELVRLTNQLIKSQHLEDFMQLSQEFNTILQQGV